MSYAMPFFEKKDYGPMTCAGRARHPRSRAEQKLLANLQDSISRSLSICKSGAGEDVLAYEQARAAEEARKSRAKLVEEVVACAKQARLSSNGPPCPSLFYDMPPASVLGTGLRGHPHSLVPDHLADAAYRDAAYSDAAYRNYNVRQLSEYARSTLLLEVSDYLPPHRDGINARKRFDELLTRLQQHQLACTVQNELRARRPDSMWLWAESRYRLVPQTSVTKRPIPINAWASFIQANPAAKDPILEIVHASRAVRHSAEA
jgi:hypothetical protein